MHWSPTRSLTGHAVGLVVQVIVAFGSKRNSLVIVGTNGTFYKCSFDPVKGGDCKQDSYCKFIKRGEATQQ